MLELLRQTNVALQALAADAASGHAAEQALLGLARVIAVEISRGH
jgi:hypothetical protein